MTLVPTSAHVVSYSSQPAEAIWRQPLELKFQFPTKHNRNTCQSFPANLCQPETSPSCGASFLTTPRVLLVRDRWQRHIHWLPSLLPTSSRSGTVEPQIPFVVPAEKPWNDQSEMQNSWIASCNYAFKFSDSVSSCRTDLCHLCRNFLQIDSLNQSRATYVIVHNTRTELPQSVNWWCFNHCSEWSSLINFQPTATWRSS